MKAFAVVRKPPPRNAQHVLKVRMQNPHVAIQPIQQNQTISIRRDSKEEPLHSLERKSAHFSVQNSLKDATRFSVSPSRRNRIFDNYETSRSKQKRAKLDNSLSESVKKKQQAEIKAIPLLSELISRESQKKQRARLRSQKQSHVVTPQKKKDLLQISTPFDRLQQSSIQNEKAGGIYYQSLQIQQRQKELPFHSRQMTRSIPTRDIQVRKPIFQREKIKNKTSDVLEPTKTPFYSRVSHMNQGEVSDKASQRSESVVNIGCCGEPLETEITDKKARSLHRTAYDRSLTQYNAYNSIHEANSYSIVEGINNSFQNTKAQDKGRSFHRKIFPQFNPESQSSKVRQDLSYKKDKINSKPVMTLDQSSKSSKIYRVTVYQIRTFEPFQF